jgi:hypothetical protein
MTNPEMRNHIAALPAITAGGKNYLSHQAVTNAVAAFLFPTLSLDQIDEVGYRCILETADSLCHELGYAGIVKLAPPEVPFNQTGLYWAKGSMADKADNNRRFELGYIVMTPGVAALGIDVGPYLVRHMQADWGDEMDRFDWQQNNQAVKEGLRILSAYNVPLKNGEKERIWIITEADRSSTTLLLPSEY